MTFNSTMTLVNDESGKPELKLTLDIYNLDGKEGTETVADAVRGLTEVLSGFDAQTGAKV